jgi:hypothetical protein
MARSSRSEEVRPRPARDHLRAVPPPAPDDDEVGIELDGEEAPLLAEGEYLGTYISNRTRHVFGERKVLEVVFELVYTAAGDAVPEDTCLTMYCRLPRGRIKPSSKWARCWKLVAGRRLHRGERMRPSILRNKLRLAVITVRTSSQQRALEPVNYYSKVDHVIAVETGGPAQP